MRSHLTSLRFRSILLVLLAVMPALVLLLVGAGNDRRTAKSSAQDDALRMARVITANQDDVLAGARQMLATLARLPEVRDHNAEDCSRLFTDLLKEFPSYTGITASDTDGNVFCSAVPLMAPLNVADRPWFQRARQTRAFAIDDYVMGRISGKPILPVGYPVLDSTNNIVAYVAAGLTLESLSQFGPEIQLPHGAAITVLDHSGTILSRSPDPGAWVGQSAAGSDIGTIILSQRTAGIAEATGIDGVARLYGFAPLGTGPGEAYISVGIPTSVAYAPADANATRNFLGLALATAFALMAAWFGGELLILRPLRVLQGVTQRLASGDLDARTGLSHESRELNLLAADFDSMAASLKERVAERLEAEAQLQTTNQRLQALIDASPLAIATLDIHGNVVTWNPASERMFGWTKQEALGKPPPHLPESDMVEFRERFQRLLDGEPVRGLEQKRVRKDGTTLEISLSTAVLRDETGSVAGVMSMIEDISRRKWVEEALLRGHEALREANERLHALIETSPLAIYTLDADGDVTSWNLAASRLFGWTEEEVLGRPLPHIPEADWPEFRARFQRLLLGEPQTNLELRRKRRDGTDIDISVSTARLHDATGAVCGTMAILTDITERKQMEAELARQAFHDSVTQLPNRALFLDRLGQALAQTRRFQQTVAVLFIDLDNFKVINDSLGHQAGDSLLRAVAVRLQSALRSEDTVARLGGDEFTILMTNIQDEVDAIHLAERLQRELQSPFALDGHEVFLTCSIGIARSSPEHDHPEKLVRDADVAMYRAKMNGKSQYVLFDRTMGQRAQGRFALETDLRRALERQEFQVFYQPIVHLGSGEVAGLEALVRWLHPERGLVTPGDFIPLAEETGLIVPIGRWVLHDACAFFQKWQASVPARQDFHINVNLSPRQLQDPRLVGDVASILQDTGLQPASLCLEITEGAIMQDTESAITKLHDLKALGIQLAIDDFGTGYCSLAYLKRFPVDVLKIDKFFVDELGIEDGSSPIIPAILMFAHTMQLEVTAEGIEREEQLTRLRAIGCNHGQGYYFARPMPAAALDAFLDSTIATAPIRASLRPTA